MAVPTIPSGATGTPVYSQTPGPGSSTTQGPLGIVNHAQWIDAFINYWTTRWANGDHTLPAFMQGSEAAKLYGSPSQTGTGGLDDPTVRLAFARAAAAYHTGMDPTIDSLMPWVPPGPQDYTEDPTITAARTADQEFQQNFAEMQRQFGLTLDATERQNLRDAFNKAFQNQLTQYATSANIFNTQTQAALNAYNTQAQLFTSGESNRTTQLTQAGTLADDLQKIMDARTQSAIALKANPGDYIQEEYATRALGNPNGTSNPAYSNVDALSEVIHRLINYQPPPAPTAPVINNGQPITPPTPPNQATFTPPPGAMGNPIPPAGGTPPPPVNHAPAPIIPHPAQPIPPSGGMDTTGPGVMNDHLGHYSYDGGRTWQDNSGHYSYDGTNWLNKSDNTPWHDPSLGTMSTAGSSTSSPTLGTISTAGSSIPALALGGGTTARQFIAGDPQRPGVVNPEMVQILNPGPRTTAKVTPLLQGIRNMRKPKFADGTDPNLNPYGDPNNPNLPSYPDSVYQNLPVVRYNQDSNYGSIYNTLAKGYTTGAFGQQVAEPGSFNYRDYTQHVANDPVALAMLTSSYKAANRDLASTVARAQQRAPFGTSIQTSLIKS